MDDVLDAEIRRLRQKVASQVGAADSPLGPPLAPITDAERDAALHLLLSLCEDQDPAGAAESVDVTRDEADRLLIDALSAVRAEARSAS